MPAPTRRKPKSEVPLAAEPVEGEAAEAPDMTEVASSLGDESTAQDSPLSAAAEEFLPAAESSTVGMPSIEEEPVESSSEA